MKNRITILGIIDCSLYALIVTLYIVFKTELLLTLWEALTILSAPIMLLILLDILHRHGQAQGLYYTLTAVFGGCLIALTGAAHFVNITVTRRLIAQGVRVPTYLQIGHWPSAEMAVDYLAWGLFMGLAFITCACALGAAGKGVKRLKSTLIICGGLCLSGFLGSSMINENLWYLAPLGYGIGMILVCIQMLPIGNNPKAA